MNELPPGDWSWIDEVATRFDRAWKAGHRPRLEDYLAGAAEPRRAALFEELLRVELEIRHAAGEQPTSAEYRRRFPGEAPAIDALFLPPAVETADPGGSPEGIGKYRIRRLLGGGGQARTYLAFDPDLKRQVVLKLYHTARTPAQQDLVLREGQALARVRSRFLAQCHSVERQGDRVYLVLEYIPGKDLAKVQLDRPLGVCPSIRSKTSQVPFIKRFATFEFN